ncbi:6718_t:CDS:2, partial [Rhizophagus irregularis]
MPRQNPHYYPPCIIMWSSLSATSFQNSGKSNHFVPVFKKKSSYYDSNLPQFLEKTIPKDLLSSSFQDNYINLAVDEAKDFQFTISQEEASSLFIYNIENCNYHWRPWQISNYYLVELLKGQSEFPPQISISVLKTSETNKNLIKYCYCGGCDKKNQTLFRIIINNIDLIQSKEFVKINVIYSTNKRQCRHLDGKIFGQCRGYARQVLSRSVEFKSPRQMRKKILSNVKNEVRYTGNRQGIPSAHSARTIYSEKEKNESGYNLCERAIRHHVRSKKFMIESGYDREIISKFAMRIWNAVRVKENILDAEKEIEKWEWVMNQKYLKLINKDIKLAGRKILTENFDVTVIPDLLIHMDSDCFDLSSSIGENIYNNPMCISNLLNQEQENLWTYRLDNNILLKILCDENKNFRLLVPQLGITVDAQLSPFDSIKNPFYSLNLINYLDKVWWKTIVLWSNLVPAIKNRTRRTTATVEVENHIVKNLDIGKKNLPIDQYLYVRTQTLKSTQNLIAETLMRNSKIHKTSNDLYEQWQPKKKKVFSKEEINIINDFKTVMEYRKGLDAPSQSRIAREIREISTVQIGFNQSMVSLIVINKDKGLVNE